MKPALRPPGLPLRSQSLIAIVLGTLLALDGSLANAAAPGPVTKTEHFDRDPGWEGFGNRVTPARVPTVAQNFGYQPGTSAGEKGSIGGQVTRASRPAYYAERIRRKTLQQKLTASGSFRLTASTGSSGVFFGWFNSDQPGGSGRPIGSLGLDFDGEGKGGRLAVRLINANNKSCGTFVTPFIPGKFRPTPIRNDSTRYSWKLAYDPVGNSGTGSFSFTIQSDRTDREEFEGRTFTVNLPAGFKAEGAAFDRFGLMNMMKAGGKMSIQFGDLIHDGTALDLSRDPGWVGSGNKTTYVEPDPAGAHDFGFSPDTHFAGGSPGEIGGKFWRAGKYGYYADRVGPLDLGGRLEASGKVVLVVGGPDSDMFLGWFNSASKDRSPAEAGSFIGVHIGGPTRVGHYFQPAYCFGEKARATAAAGPILVRKKAQEWKLTYDPTENSGTGAITVVLDGKSVTLPLRKGQSGLAPTFDRFGLFTTTIGGQMVKVYFDDLTYTIGQR